MNWYGIGSILLASLGVFGCGGEHGDDGAGDDGTGSARSSIVSARAAGGGVPDPPSASVATNVRLGWMFCGIVDGEPVPVENRTILRSGTELRLVLQVERAASVFVLAEAAAGNVHLLFPRDESDLSGRELPYSAWLMDGVKLDSSVGEERVHLVAASEPLDALTDLVRERFRAENGAGDLDRRMLAEVQRIRRDRGNLPAVTSRPTRIGGAMRDSSLEPTAVLLEADGLLYRRFTIDHR